MATKPTTEFRTLAVEVAVCIVILLWRDGLLPGVWLLLAAVISGYFVGDVAVAYSHFMIDNFQPDNDGYRHHVELATASKAHSNSAPYAVAKQLCAPGCAPCGPCQPCSPGQCGSNFKTIKQALTVWSLDFKLIKAIAIWNFPVLTMAYLISNVLSAISACGAPDYFAHHPNRAPAIARLAQKLRLMMTPAAHDYHHKHPSRGYAYFSPLTNFVLDNTGVWVAVRVFVETATGRKAHLVPAAE